MSSLLSLALCALALLVAGPSSALGREAQPQVTVAGVSYQGVLSEDGSVQAFLGLPFAQPPVGDARWQAPAPLQPGRGSRDATRFAPACAQGPHMVKWYRGVASSFGGDPASVPVPEFSEDCLYLNVWTPAKRGDDPLPVIVFIHGGSNKGGWSFESTYIGAELARQGAVVVTLAYRVGILGFFSHPQLPQSNFGLLDQVAGLRWIQQQIASFGGDPCRVTVAGESSGANNIAHLLVSPLARGLFQRAIHQSAGWGVDSRSTRKEMLASGRKLSRSAGGAENDIEVLRALGAEQVIGLAEQQLPDHEYDPVIDGDSLPAPMAELLAAGDFDEVDLIIGSNADEWLMYLDEDASLEEWMQENLSGKQISALRPLLAGAGDQRRKLDRLITAQAYVCPSLQLAAAVESNGGHSWMYYFTRQRPGAQAATMGAYHGAELPYVFNSHDSWLPADEKDAELTRLIMGYWTAFARRGDPNGAGRLHWPEFSGGERILVLDVPSHVKPHPSLPLCAALAEN